MKSGRGQSEACPPFESACLLTRSSAPRAVHPQRRAGGRGGLGRADIDDHVRDLLDAREAPGQRGRTVGGDELLLQRLRRHALLPGKLGEEIDHALGPGRPRQHGIHGDASAGDGFREAARDRELRLIMP
jgi:hypothetical protein